MDPVESRTKYISAFRTVFSASAPAGSPSPRLIRMANAIIRDSSLFLKVMYMPPFSFVFAREQKRKRRRRLCCLFDLSSPYCRNKTFLGWRDPPAFRPWMPASRMVLLEDIGNQKICSRNIICTAHECFNRKNIFNNLFIIVIDKKHYGIEN